RALGLGRWIVRLLVRADQMLRTLEDEPAAEPLGQGGDELPAVRAEVVQRRDLELLLTRDVLDPVLPLRRRGEHTRRPLPEPPQRRVASLAQRQAAYPLRIGPETVEDAVRDPRVLASEAEQDVLGLDLLAPESARLAERELEHLLAAWRER